MCMHSSFVHSILKIKIYKTLFIFFLNESLNTTRTQAMDILTQNSIMILVLVRTSVATLQSFLGEVFCTEMKLLIVPYAFITCIIS